MYGCNTRNKDYKGVQDTFLVQDGYYDFVTTREPRYVIVPNRNSRDCRYDRVNIDQKCSGCERGNHMRVHEKGRKFMTNSITEEQRIRLIARLEKDLKESGESQKKERKIITLRKKKETKNANSRVSDR